MSEMWEDVVISGISCRLPESANIQEFSDNLYNGVDMVTEDTRRWPIGHHGLPTRSGKLTQLDKFDATFFGMHTKQAEVLDPQLRNLLELTFEAIVDAGVNPASIRGSKTGVYIACSTYEAHEYWALNPDVISGYEMTGGCLSMLPNRISYTFDFNGPSVCMDTACSSTLVAITAALAAIRAGACEAAIVGGSTLTLKPSNSIEFNRLSMLSSDGKCKSFDKSANGYVRSEAISVIYIQKAKVARRSYATLVHAKTNLDGYKQQGITFPSGRMQKALMQETYGEAGIDPNDVFYVEAHGTGTKMGDPQEVNAIADFFCQKRDKNKPLLIGSVKSNMGHAETGSGLASVAKMLLSMTNKKIPANLHFSEPNPDIPALLDGRIKVITKNHDWDGDLIGINSSGFGGCNAHVILRANQKIKLTPTKPKTSILVPISGRTEEAVQYALDWVGSKHEDNELVGLLHGLSQDNITGHHFRGYFLSSENETDSIVMQRSTAEGKPEIWFVFSGMGSQWSGMAENLLNFEVFSNSIHSSARILAREGLDLLEILRGDGNSLENVVNSFVAIVAMQVALVDLLGDLGILPDGIVGHSVGELCCAYADGCFTAEQTVLAAHARGKAILESKVADGSMAAIGLTWEEAKIRCPPDVFPACHNSEHSVSISGPVGSIKKFVDQLTHEGVFAREVKSCGQAFHSKYIADAGPKLKKRLQAILKEPSIRSGRWVSSSIPESQWDSPVSKYSSVDYHVNNFLSPVLFHEALAHVPEGAVVIEIAPHALLQAILKRSLPASCTNIGLTHRDATRNDDHFLSAVGKMYAAGLNPQIANLYPKVDFPVCLGTPIISPMIKWDHSISWDVPTFVKADKECVESVVEMSLTKEENEYIKGHIIDGRILYPATAYLVMIWKTFAKLHGTTYDKMAVIFENVSLERVTILQTEDTVKFTITILNGKFEVHESGAVTITGFIRASDNISQEFIPLTSEIPSVSPHTPLSAQDVYKEMRLCGYEYTGLFLGIKSCDNQSNWARISWDANWVTFLDTMLQIYCISRPKRALYLPKRLRRVVIDPTVFLQFLNDNQDEVQTKGVPLFLNKELNIVQCHGLEMNGVKPNMVSRRQNIQVAPKMEEYCFTPYFDESSAKKAFPLLNETNALKMCVDLVIENTPTMRLRVSEVTLDLENCLSPAIQQFIEEQPMCQSEISLVTRSSSEDNEFKEIEKIGIQIMQKDNSEKLMPDPENNLIVVENDKLINLVETSIKAGGFLLFHTNAGNKIVIKQDLLTPVAHKITTTRQFFLFRKLRDNLAKENVNIVVDSTVGSWLDKLKQHMAIASKMPYYPRIHLMTENEKHSGIVGLVNCLRQEPGGDKIRMILANDPLEKNSLDFSNPSFTLKKILDSDLFQNVYKGYSWGSYRHFPLDDALLTHKPSEHAFINTLTRGDLSSLTWIQSPLKYSESTNEYELCSVYYTGMNFRDIMLATGKLPPDALPGNLALLQDCLLGMEFSGKNRHGKRVMGIVLYRGLATSLMVDPAILWDVPSSWSLEDAATVPMAYGTSYYSLIVRGSLQPGESVLIHSGSGAVGQAAIIIALSMNCLVYTTVGTPEKKSLLLRIFPQLKGDHITNSRDLSFEVDIMRWTKGRGVDVILNSLAEDKLQASVRCLAQHGRFLEIGKHDLAENNNLGLSVFLKNISFCGILLDCLFEKGAPHRDTVARLLKEGIQSGVVKPLQRTVFSDNEIEDTFRFMTTGKHTGKVLLKIRNEEDRPSDKIVNAIPRTYFDPKLSYIIIGGLGGVGLELCGWMVDRGATNIVLVSRSGITTGYQSYSVRRWKEAGVQITIFKSDVASNAAVEQLLKEAAKLGGVGGIFNLAMVLKDGFLEKQTVSNFESVIKPKLTSTLLLDQETRRSCPNLEYFVVFSSMSSGRGNAGQSNYGMANSAMERVCELRREDGLPGLAIQWGAIGDVGVVMDTMGGNEIIIGGTLPQRLPSCLASLDTFLQQTRPVVSCMVLGDRLTARKDGGEKKSVSTIVARILGMKDVSKVNPNVSLAELGMDSLMGAEVKQTLEREQGLVLSMQELGMLTFLKLKEYDA